MSWQNIHSPKSCLCLIYTKQTKLVWFLLSDQFCQAIYPIFVSIQLTDNTLHKNGQRDRKILISKLVREPDKIRWTAWQNQSDVTKIGSTTVHVNRGLGKVGHLRVYKKQGGWEPSKFYFTHCDVDTHTRLKFHSFDFKRWMGYSKSSISSLQK